MIAKHVLASAAPTQRKWGGIDWLHHQAVVKKLQVRIAKAVKEGKTGKVKALQWLLTTSFSAKVLAVRKVTQNKGKNTPGVDGVTLQGSSQKLALVKQLKRRNYEPRPLRRVYIKKKNGKLRPLSIPTIRDRVMQQIHYMAISPISETTSDPNSYGFRPKRSCADAIEQVFCALSRQDAPKWILEGDIRGCFDNISHEWMLNNICIDKIILAKWLKAGYIETKKLFPTQAGTPQGGIISPCLSNFVLDGIEKLLDNNFGERRRGINFVRYADDFIITGKTREILEQRVKPLIADFLKERGLELSEEKTKITHIDDGFDFLGQNVRKYPDGMDKRKLLIKPSKENTKAFQKKVRDVIKTSIPVTQAKLINRLNPIIRGWANYHKSVVSKATFSKVDNCIYTALYRWAIRRHPKKSKRWVMKRYFIQIGNRAYCFSGKEKLVNGSLATRKLFRAAEKPIKRHVKIRSESNVFDPNHEAYFEKRYSSTLMDSKTGFDMVIRLLKRQLFKCPCCHNNLSIKQKWIANPMKSVLKGGDYQSSNLCIIHENCHRIGFRKSFVYTAGCPQQG